MFFNEDLYLEADEMSDEKEITEGEIAEAVESVPEDEAIAEGHELYTRALEKLEVINESYYNLREKMMNIEHIASLKEKDGLFSESEMFFNEGLDQFKAKIIKIFKKLGDMIKEIFNRFINFLMGMSVTMTELKKTNAKTAWASFIANNPNGISVKVMALNDKVFQGMSFSQKMDETTKNLMEEAKRYVEDLKTEFEGAVDETRAKELSEKLKRPSKLKLRIENTQNEIEKVVANLAEGDSQLIGKKEYTIDDDGDGETFFTSRLNYCKEGHKNLMNKAKGYKDAALKTIDSAIKAVQKMKVSKNSYQKKLQGPVIADMRWNTNLQVKIFSKYTSLMSSFYRESLLICKRIIGNNKFNSAKEKVKFGEGFDFANYFAD